LFFQFFFAPSISLPPRQFDSLNPSFSGSRSTDGILSCSLYPFAPSIRLFSPLTPQSLFTFASNQSNLLLDNGSLIDRKVFPPPFFSTTSSHVRPVFFTHPLLRPLHSLKSRVPTFPLQYLISPGIYSPSRPGTPSSPPLFHSSCLYLCTVSPKVEVSPDFRSIHSNGSLSCFLVFHSIRGRRSFFRLSSGNSFFERPYPLSALSPSLFLFPMLPFQHYQASLLLFS